jgi:hypothetical protein
VSRCRKGVKRRSFAPILPLTPEFVSTGFLILRQSRESGGGADPRLAAAGLHLGWAVVRKIVRESPLLDIVASNLQRSISAARRKAAVLRDAPRPVPSATCANTSLRIRGVDGNLQMTGMREQRTPFNRQVHRLIG